MLASTIRRRLRGNEVTYVRVADLKVGTTTERVADADSWLCRRGADLSHAHQHSTQPSRSWRRRAISPGRRRFRLSAFSSSSKLPEGLPVVLSALKKAGLATITQAPIDRLSAPEGALDALADAGLELARLTVDETPELANGRLCAARSQPCRHGWARFAHLRPLARKIDATQPTTGYEDVKRIAVSRAARRQRRYDPGRLGAVRPEARAGGADVRCRRHRLRFGGRRSNAGAAPFTCRRNPQKHPGGWLRACRT